MRHMAPEGVMPWRGLINATSAVLPHGFSVFSDSPALFFWIFRSGCIVTMCGFWMCLWTVLSISINLKRGMWPQWALHHGAKCMYIYPKGCACLSMLKFALCHAKCLAPIPCHHKLHLYLALNPGHLSASHPLHHH